jgi:hypothetical protein
MRKTSLLLLLLLAIVALEGALWIISRPTSLRAAAPITRQRSQSVSEDVLKGLPPPAEAARIALPKSLGPEGDTADEVEVGELSISGDKFVTKTTKVRRHIFFPTGERYAESPMLDGRENGTCKCWYKSGQLHAEEEYVSGTREGTSTYYSESGARIAEGAYFHGYMDGTWVTWYENGIKESEGFYDTMRTWDAGVHAQDKSGYWAFWDPDGRIDTERSGTYEHDKQVSR